MIDQNPKREAKELAQRALGGDPAITMHNLAYAVEKALRGDPDTFGYPEGAVDWEAKVGDGDKYVFQFMQGGGSRVLRNGEPWRVTTGDNFILSLAAALVDTRAELAKTKGELEALRWDQAEEGERQEPDGGLTPENATRVWDQNDPPPDVVVDVLLASIAGPGDQEFDPWLEQLRLAVDGWSREERVAAVEYAGACLFAASDNEGVEIPPVPQVLVDAKVVLPRRNLEEDPEPRHPVKEEAWNPDPVERIPGTDQWRFWDEVWANEHGPYSSEEEARAALRRYVEEHLDRPKDGGTDHAG
jgi:hypothetical protein